MQAFSTIEEVARTLRVHPETVRRSIDAGHVKAIKVGRQWRVSAEEFERLQRDGMATEPVTHEPR